MSAPDRRAMVERPGKGLSVRRQCALVGVARSGVYRPKPVVGADDLAVMRRIDALHTAHPFLGSRRIARMLGEAGALIALAVGIDYCAADDSGGGGWRAKNSWFGWSG